MRHIKRDRANKRGGENEGGIGQPIKQTFIPPELNMYKWTYIEGVIGFTLFYCF